MEKIITLKVDLEYPEEAHHAIDEAVDAYEADAAVNGLAYDRELEESTAEQFAVAFERCIAQGLCAGAPVRTPYHQAWTSAKTGGTCTYTAEGRRRRSARAVSSAWKR